MQTAISKSEKKAQIALSYLPKGISDEIRRISQGRLLGLSDIREIRIRAEGRCSMLLGGESIRLCAKIRVDEMEELVNRLSGGALYAHRDSIASGYITLPGGIRVGISGHAKYEYKSFVGVCEMRSLVFRIPGHECAFSDEIYGIWLSGVKRGMLIYSPPGVGKTTALRSLAGSIGSGKYPQRVCVIDERCEFDGEDYSDCEVDLLKGYKRRSGIEIATRTMSPQVIIIDEIGADDGRGIAEVSRAGIPIIASAHAAGYDELLSKPALSELLKCGAFDVFVGISERGGEYSLTVDKK